MNRKQIDARLKAVTYGPEPHLLAVLNLENPSGADDINQRLASALGSDGANRLIANWYREDIRALLDEIDGRSR